METSAKQNINVEELFKAVGTKIKNNIVDTKRKSTIKQSAKSSSKIETPASQSQAQTQQKPALS